MNKEAWDVGREQTEQLQKVRPAYEEYDAIFRAFRAAIVRSDAAEKVNKRTPEWTSVIGPLDEAQGDEGFLMATPLRSPKSG
jgi:hypothetical protein